MTMPGTVLTLDALLFGALPYAAVIVFLLASIARYRGWRFSYSSLSSQFLENRQHFWGLVPFHYGILVVLTGHLVAFLIPREILAWNSHPLRLYVIEVSALAFGALTLVGWGGWSAARPFRRSGS
jgi:nitrate reductase gamma subunit